MSHKCDNKAISIGPDEMPQHQLDLHCKFAVTSVIFNAKLFENFDQQPTAFLMNKSPRMIRKVVYFA